MCRPRVAWAVLACCLGWAWSVATAQSPGDSAAPAVSKTADLLRAGAEPVRIVCLGDSVTGVYYHTLLIAAKRERDCVTADLGGATCLIAGGLLKEIM